MVLLMENKQTINTVNTPFIESSNKNQPTLFDGIENLEIEYIYAGDPAEDFIRDDFETIDDDEPILKFDFGY